MNRPGLAVVIPHFNRLQETRTCCASLQRQTLSPAAIIVVDNGSTSHTREELAAACPDGVTPVFASRNLGFAGGCNLGIRQALEHPGVEHVLLLNNDTECPDDLLARMADALADKRVGLVGSPMVEGERRLPVAAGKRLLRPFAIPLAAQPGSLPDYLSGACLLIRGDVLREVGLLDEGFFFFFEDADYCLRVKQAGWRLGIVDGAPLFHHGSSTIARLAEMQAHTYRTGHIRYLRKHGTLPMLAAAAPFLGRLAIDLAGRNTAALRGSWNGWRQGWAQGRPTTHAVAPAVSVIIPAFNVAPYIRECLDSVLTQTWSDLEVICVDNGSTDATRAVLEDIRVRDARVRVVETDGRGAAAARNYGMQLARGRYIWFMDGDDLCDRRLCAAAMGRAEATNADVVVFRFDERDAAGGAHLATFAFPPAVRRRGPLLDDGLMVGGLFCEGNFAGSVWNKLFRTAFIRRHDIRFPDTRTSEDTAFTVQAMLAATRIGLVDEVLYHYRRNVADGLTARRREHPLDFCEAWQDVLTRADGLAIDPARRNLLIGHVFALMVEALHRAGTAEDFARVFDAVRTRWLGPFGIDGAPERLPLKNRNFYAGFLADLTAAPDAFAFLARRAVFKTTCEENQA